ncbi:hypothetical protein B0H16DRAFT_1898879 [Mycena metata]|uniref:Uncharacterized protein n=1 Tax=Mycena metata TaxID=1033252 RepID=A0AAD7MFD7_9AGAR|nr:hypothetical protein B0H16DRAFT_1898879 [Mycena metata]
MSTCAENTEVFDFDIVIARGSLRVTEDREIIGRADSRYAPLRDAATVVFGHLRRSNHAQMRMHSLLFRMFLEHPPAKAAFKVKWGNDVGPEPSLVKEYLAKHLPTLVLASPTDLDAELTKKQLAWGLVLKEDSELGNANEIFLPKDLADLIVSRKGASPVAEMQRLVWSVSLEHEIMHALTDYAFPHISTPLLEGVGLDRNNGEAGHAFELLHLGFIIEVEIPKKEVKTPHRMQHMTRILGRTNSTTFEIDEATVDLLLSSLESNRIHDVDVAVQQKYVNQRHQSYGRFRIGGYPTDEAEDDVVCGGERQ